MLFKGISAIWRSRNRAPIRHWIFSSTLCNRSYLREMTYVVDYTKNNSKIKCLYGFVLIFNSFFTFECFQIFQVALFCPVIVQISLLVHKLVNGRLKYLRGVFQRASYLQVPRFTVTVLTPYDKNTFFQCTFKTIFVIVAKCHTFPIVIRY